MAPAPSIAIVRESGRASSRVASPAPAAVLIAVRAGPSTSPVQAPSPSKMATIPKGLPGTVDTTLTPDRLPTRPGMNIDGPPVADPESGILYVTSRKHCTTRIMAPGAERDALLVKPTGTTIADFAVLSGFGVRGPDDLNLFKPPYSRITAIDMNTGEHLWYIPVGETPERVLNHPQLQDIDIPNTGTGEAAQMTVTRNLLIYAGNASDGTPHLYAIDKATGEQLGKVEAPANSSYGMMTYVHEGKQYLILQTASTLTAMALYED